MRKLNPFLLICIAICISLTARAQKADVATRSQLNATKEIEKFFEGYADDLRNHRREAIADRYDRRGTFSMGNGRKNFDSFDVVKSRYLQKWNGPKSFQWKDLSVDVLSRDVVAVLAKFEWETEKGQIYKYSYTGVLVRRDGKWRIRVEDESSGQ